MYVYSSIVSILVIITIVTNGTDAEIESFSNFPKDFVFGVSTAAYQVEGAWNVSNKSESIWDHIVHYHPSNVIDGASGDITCDCYHKIDEDVALLKQLGVNFYRFSLSWTRILPQPLTKNVDEDGIRYYNKLIDTLLESGIQPIVTIFHWDLPLSLHILGGFTNPLIISAYVNFARVAFENFGDRVKTWITFNEPGVFCLELYGYDKLKLSLNQSGIADYISGHRLLLAHAKAYHLYNDVFRPTQHGKITISLDATWSEPASSSKEDIAAANRRLEFELGWFANPIFSKTGDYPTIMKENIAKRSEAEGFIHSRLPSFSKDEIEMIKGSADFFSLNHYTTFLVADKKPDPIGSPYFDKDENVEAFFDESWPNTVISSKKVVPWGFTKLLKYIKEKYDNPEILITENGYGDTGGLEDSKRVDYLRDYLNAVLRAIHEHGVRVKGYTHWSFMDTFEWIFGYSHKYGLHHVNFSDPNRARTPKSSAWYYKQIIQNRTL